MKPHPLRATWYGIIHRAKKRGVIVHPLWQRSFADFKEWAIENGWEKGMVIDRIENDGGYEPGNCQFLSKYEHGCKTILFDGGKKTPKYLRKNMPEQTSNDNDIT